MATRALTEADGRARATMGEGGVALGEVERVFVTGRGRRTTRVAALSGGMRQRVAFLRTLLAGKPVLCLDEPFGALDSLTRGEMQTWLAGALAADPRTVLLVTHDVEEALMLRSVPQLHTPRAWAAVVVLAVLAVTLFTALRALEPRLSPQAQGSPT